MKTEYIIVRVDPATKLRLASVAESRGLNLSTFLLQAAEQAARKETKMTALAMEKPRGKGPCPTWFLATCIECGRGGSATYAWAGRKLLKALPGESPYEYEEDEWNAKLDQLEGLLGAKDDDGAIAWLEAELPRCMKLVPKRRREQFLKGMYEVFENDGDIPR